jgi:hypothetical protein
MPATARRTILAALETCNIDARIATGRQKHGAAAPEARPAEAQSRVAAMAAKRCAGREGRCRLRKQVVEPVFGRSSGRAAVASSRGVA